MYLSRLEIKNFRAFGTLELNFNKGVNILIGENNSGKSSIIDALRICLGFGKPEKDIYIKETDLHINPNDPAENNNEIQFDLTFEIGENSAIKECFYDFISLEGEVQKIKFHLKYTLEDKGKKHYFKRTIWGGDNEGQGVPYEALQELFYTYLSPLRDAVSGLRPYSYDNKTSQLFNRLTKFIKEGSEIRLDENKKKQLASNLYSVFESSENDWKDILKTGKGKVNDHLDGTGINQKSPKIQMTYVGRKFSDVVRGIELKRPVYPNENLGNFEQLYFELFQNGLGENNLIYASVVLGDLINRCEDDQLELYNALLVEEPEAHLHPQYQNTFFEYLNKLEDKGLQIFITSHSPTITAKSNLNNIIILQRQSHTISSFSFSLLAENDFSDSNRKHLRKFLDTSKSQLFFANGVILVEGIAEAILIPLLSRKFLKPATVDLEKNGIEIVNISGVAFEHFAKLYNNEDESKRLLSKCAIITDSDPKEEKPISDRALLAEGFKNANLDVELAPNTFEYDLFEESDVNKEIMREVYRTMHPNTTDLSGEFSVEILMLKLKSNKDKGDFALNLYDKLLSKDDFNVPTYISNAIGFVISSINRNGEETNS